MKGASAAETRVRVWTLLLAVAFGAFLLHPTNDHDTFWHLALGKAVLQHHARTFADPIAFLAFSRPCIAAEWLWEIVTFSLFRAGGYRILSVFLALLGMGACALSVKLVARHRTSGRLDVVVLVSTLVATATLSRATLRPQAAYLLLLPAFLLLTMRYWEASGRARLWSGLQLIALQLLWVQLHGSFVLAPAIFGLFLIARLDLERERRQAHLLVLFGLLAAMLTSAYGWSFLSYLTAHAHGDSVRHIEDMRAPSWDTISPAAPYNVAYLALALLAVYGALQPDRSRVLHLLLAGLGLALFVTASRFVDVSAILLVPLAMRGAEAARALLPPKRATSLVMLASSVALIGWFGLEARRWWGPAGTLGLVETGHPVAAAAAVRALPPGQNVLSSFGASGALGFWLYDHSRTFVDGRTPLYFDDTDYGVARDVWFQPRALAAGILRYGVTVVVAPRDGIMCQRLAETWMPISIEAGFTTFVRRKSGPAGLLELTACGDEYLPKDPCGEHLAPLREELARLATLRSSPFYELLAAEALARCHAPVAEVEAALPSRAAAWEYRLEWNRTHARLLLAQGRAADAFLAVEDQISTGDLRALDLVFPAVLDAVPVARVRAALAAVARGLDDETPAGLRASLAKLCMTEGDEECVRFSATRAAAAGNPQAIEPLLWLHEHGSSERVRADAGEWLRLLRLHAPAEAPAVPPRDRLKPASE